jgi:AraC-like DNA-binding protein
MVLPCPSDRELGIAPPLRRGRLAGARGDDPVVYLLAHLGEGQVTLDDAPRVEVDVPRHTGEDTTVGGDFQARREIAAAAGLSRRVVQVAFRRHLDTTPTAYLRKVRLDLAHAELLTACPDDELTVTEVAYRWGFSSPSRFAERYRAEFGRLPSEMLRR